VYVLFRESLAFATEPVLCSLANVLNQHDNLPQQALAALKDYTFFDVEIKYGLLQVSTLFFLIFYIFMLPSRGGEMPILRPLTMDQVTTWSLNKRHFEQGHWSSFHGHVLVTMWSGGQWSPLSLPPVLVVGTVRIFLCMVKPVIFDLFWLTKLSCVVLAE